MEATVRSIKNASKVRPKSETVWVALGERPRRCRYDEFGPFLERLEGGMKTHSQFVEKAECIDLREPKVQTGMEDEK